MSGEPNEFGKSDSFFEPKVVRAVMVPTRRLWWFIIAGAPLIVLATTIGMGWMLYTYNILLGAVAFLTYQFGASVEGLRIRRRMDAVLSVRARNRVHFEIENESGVAVSGLIRDEIPSTFTGESNESKFKVAPGHKFGFEYTLTPPERGQESLRGTFLDLTAHSASFKNK